MSSTCVQSLLKKRSEKKNMFGIKFWGEREVEKKNPISAVCLNMVSEGQV